jgi:heme/copper-type cytochrome/quinol oxidase subunit 1
MDRVIGKIRTWTMAGMVGMAMAMALLLSLSLSLLLLLSLPPLFYHLVNLLAGVNGKMINLAGRQ